MGKLASHYRKEFFEVPTPSYVIAKDLLEHNLRILHEVEESTGAHVLLAQKCFSMYHYYPLIAQYLSGTTASGLYEAKLGHEEMGKENHVFSPAYKESEFAELTKICDHIIFNSFAQWKKFGPEALAAGVSCGLRINPERSTQDHAIYDPCAEGSRLGVRLRDFDESAIAGLEGLHFHTLCEQNSDDLVRTVAAFEQNFGQYMDGLKWINLGGGHHITRADYDVETLVHCIDYLQKKYKVQVYLEPGEAVVLNAGYLVATVLEVMHNHKDIAMYRGGEPGKKAFTYLLTGRSCLAGDVIGEYSFDVALGAGEQVVFEDMALYTMVKTNTFNGMPLPLIAIRRADGTDEVVRMFGYEEFKRRLS